MTNFEDRKIGKYHHGEQMKVVSARIPVDMWELVRDHADRNGRTLSEQIEFALLNSVLRKR